MKKNNYLVTGAAGFIGSFLINKLLEKGHAVIGVDNLFRGKLSNLDDAFIYKDFKFKELDISAYKSIENLNKIITNNKIEIVFHLAAINGTQYFYERPLFVFEKNIILTQNILKAIENTEVKKIICTSSSEVYGDPKIIPTPESEKISLNPLSTRDSYASSKAIGEFYIKYFSDQYDIDYKILRVFNMYGPKMDSTKYGQVIPEFISKVNNKSPFTIIGDGTQTRSFCYIEDAVSIMEKISVINTDYNIINVGNDNEVSILYLAEKIHQLMNISFNPKFSAPRDHEHQRRRPDLTCLISIFGDPEFTNMDDGLNNTIKFYNNIH